MHHARYVAFGPDGEKLASASSDNSVKVWDVNTGQPALEFKGHSSPVESVAFNRDGMLPVRANLYFSQATTELNEVP